MNDNKIIAFKRALSYRAVVVTSLRRFNALAETSQLLACGSNRNRLEASLEASAQGKTLPFDLDNFQMV